jgi:UDP-N-acetylglucosamine---dolichyl-phosphate N-acetylglucosaminyltransferase
MRIFVVVPAYNEERTVVKVMEELFKRGFNLVVIDDGSNDETYKRAKNVIDKNVNKGFIYKHLLNRGLGASLRTGITAALLHDPDIIVTFDADGQHDPEDIKKVCRPIEKGEADIVIGKRNFDDMPLAKKLGNQIMNLITWIFYGVKTNDSQSGLRAFSRKAAELVNINSREYGVSSEIIGEVKTKDLKLEEVPMKTIYTDYSMSKGTNTKVGLKILFKLIMNIIK